MIVCDWWDENQKRIGIQILTYLEDLKEVKRVEKRKWHKDYRNGLQWEIKKIQSVYLIQTKLKRWFDDSLEVLFD